MQTRCKDLSNKKKTKTKKQEAERLKQSAQRAPHKKERDREKGWGTGGRRKVEQTNPGL